MINVLVIARRSLHPVLQEYIVKVTCFVFPLFIPVNFQTYSSLRISFSCHDFLDLIYNVHNFGKLRRLHHQDEDLRVILPTENNISKLCHLTDLLKAKWKWRYHGDEMYIKCDVTLYFTLCEPMNVG